MNKIINKDIRNGILEVEGTEAFVSAQLGELLKKQEIEKIE